MPVQAPTGEALNAAGETRAQIDKKIGDSPIGLDGFRQDDHMVYTDRAADRRTPEAE